MDFLAPLDFENGEHSTISFHLSAYIYYCGGYGVGMQEVLSYLNREICNDIFKPMFEIPSRNCVNIFNFSLLYQKWDIK